MSDGNETNDSVPVSEVSEVIAQHLSMPPLSLRERVPTILLEVEQAVLRALAKDPKARFASVADFARALEQASQRAFASTEQLTSEQPVLGSAAATGYETVAVAPSVPGGSASGVRSIQPSSKGRRGVHRCRLHR